MKARRFRKEHCNHVYQRTLNGFNIFYDINDYLVYYTIFSIAALKYGVSVQGLCLMIDHIHMLVTTKSKSVLSEFVSYVTSIFVREYNSSIGRVGSLFEPRFGSAPKSDRKRLLSAIIYLANNPVERKLCSMAEQYRWNFIAYLNSDHPYSKNIPRYRLPYKLRKAMSVVDAMRVECRILNYAVLNQMMCGLTLEEKNQLIDYIIVKYSVLETELPVKYFSSYAEMLTAMHSTTGSEYDIKEDFTGISDVVYRDFIKILRTKGTGTMRESLVLPQESRWSIAQELLSKTSAPVWQIAKFLHLHCEVSK